MPGLVPSGRNAVFYTNKDMVGTYTVTATSVIDPTVSDSAVINVADITIALSADVTEIFPSQKAIITAVTNLGGVTFDSQSYLTSTGMVGTYTGSSTLMGSTITITVRSAIKPTIFATIDILIKTITININPVTAHIGYNDLLNITASVNFGNLTWTKVGGDPLIGPTTLTKKTEVTSPTYNGVYTFKSLPGGTHIVTVTNTFDTSIKATCTIEVDPPPPKDQMNVTLTRVGSGSKVHGDNFTLTAGVLAGGLTWEVTGYKGNSFVTGGQYAACPPFLMDELLVVAPDTLSATTTMISTQQANVVYKVTSDIYLDLSATITVMGDPIMDNTWPQINGATAPTPSGQEPFYLNVGDTVKVRVWSTNQTRAVYWCKTGGSWAISDAYRHQLPAWINIDADNKGYTFTATAANFNALGTNNEIVIAEYNSLNYNHARVYKFKLLQPGVASTTVTSHYAWLVNTDWASYGLCDIPFEVQYKDIPPTTTLAQLKQQETWTPATGLIVLGYSAGRNYTAYYRPTIPSHATTNPINFTCNTAYGQVVFTVRVNTITSFQMDYSSMTIDKKDKFPGDATVYLQDNYIKSYTLAGSYYGGYPTTAPRLPPNRINYSSTNWNAVSMGEANTRMPMNPADYSHNYDSKVWVYKSAPTGSYTITILYNHNYDNVRTQVNVTLTDTTPTIPSYCALAIVRYDPRGYLVVDSGGVTRGDLRGYTIVGDLYEGGIWNIVNGQHKLVGFAAYYNNKQYACYYGSAWEGTFVPPPLGIPVGLHINDGEAWVLIKGNWYSVNYTGSPAYDFDMAYVSTGYIRYKNGGIYFYDLGLPETYWEDNSA
jgi:hypothetical protein